MIRGCSTYLFVLIFITSDMHAQTRQLELAMVHEQATLPLKSLPAHSINPGIRISYLYRKNEERRWLRETQLAFTRHEYLFNAVLAGYGYRYDVVPPAKSFLLQAGIMAGGLVSQSTEMTYRWTGNEWEQKPAPWKAEGWLSVSARAGWRIARYPNWQVGAGTVWWIQGPYVKQLTILLPHRNYEVFFTYNFNHYKKHPNENDPSNRQPVLPSLFL